MASVLLPTLSEVGSKGIAAALEIHDLPSPQDRLTRVLAAGRDGATREVATAWREDHPRVGIETFGSAREALTRGTGGSAAR
jgi:hypothetical protein